MLGLMNDSTNDAPGDAQPDPTSSTEDAQRKRQAEIEASASRLGGMIGRFARRVVTNAKPEVERAAAHARAAAETARPHLERAAAQAVDFAKAHEHEIKRVAERGARVVANGVVPQSLRPIMNAAEQELRRGPAPPEAPPSPPPPEGTSRS